MEKERERRVFIYAVRHGEKQKEGEDPGLTVRGRQQARATARRSFRGFGFVAVYTSGMRRTREAADEILNELGFMPFPSEAESIPFRIEPAFGYTWFVDDPTAEEYPLEEAMEKIKAAAAAEGKKVLGQWLKFYPPVLLCRGRVLQAFIEIARRHADDLVRFGDQEVRILVVSHSPVIESASDGVMYNIQQEPCLKEGGVACYKVVLDDSGENAEVSHLWSVSDALEEE